MPYRLDQLRDNGDSNSNYNTKAFAHVQLKSYKLRRFPLRAIAVIFGPLLVLGYYAFIWRTIQTRREAADTLIYGLPNELWINYSWFAVGVFGLNFSKYGLLGIEASMLHHRTWQVKNSMKLLMHCESAWSGPGGWFKCGKALLWRRKNPAGRLWYTLAILSFLPFIALPLSGLTMELGDGYVKLDEGPAGQPPMVIGHKWDDFNRRPKGAADEDVFWKTGFPPTVPGVGIAYTPPHVQRDSIPFLQEVPNILPSNVSESNPDLFLAPQADVPISGKAWGLLMGCNCSIVKSFSEFTILTRRPSFRIASAIRWTEYDADHPFRDLELSPYDETGDTILIFNNTEMGKGSNMFAHAELGFQSAGMYGSFYSQSSDEGLGFRPAVLEYALWQGHYDVDYSLQEELPFSTAIDSPMADAPSPYIQAENGTVYYNETFYLIKSNDDDGGKEGGSNNTTLISTNVANASTLLINHIAAPIGIRCIRHSMLGYADIDWHGTFRSFTETPSPPTRSNHETGVQAAFGSIGYSLAGKFYELLTSTNSPASLNFPHGIYYPSFIQADTFYRSIMLAHAWNALALMYDNTYTFESAYAYPNATGSRPSRIIGPGVVQPIYPGILFVLWAAGCFVLGCRYGFRRR